MSQRKSLGVHSAPQPDDGRSRIVACKPPSSIFHLLLQHIYTTMATIALLGTMDTKGTEYAFLAEQIQKRGHHTLVIDTGTLGEPRLKPDISRAEVASAGGADFAALVAKRDRGEAVTSMSQGASVVLSRLVNARQVDGVIALGGSGGTAIATAAMRALAIGFPKVMVSILASGNTAPYVDVKDIVMFPSIVDIAGLNRISRVLLSRAAGAICGMVEVHIDAGADKPVIVASQFGNTTPCVDRARSILEAAGYEVVVFAAVGTGGRTMESLIASGMVGACARHYDDRVGRRVGRRCAHGWTPAPGSCRPSRRTCDRFHRLSRYGELWFARDCSDKVSGTQVLPAQSTSNPDAYDSPGES